MMRGRQTIPPCAIARAGLLNGGSDETTKDRDCRGQCVRRVCFGVGATNGRNGCAQTYDRKRGGRYRHVHAKRRQGQYDGEGERALTRSAWVSHSRERG